MLEKLSDKVHECLMRANECSRKADNTASNELRDVYLSLQGCWLNLARSYEAADELLEGSSQHDWKRREFLKDKQ
jgi:hypothetical protein